ncbi:type II secretion system secretin GspD [Sansalvadorimonas sp. 2012CJ34-2]|uniref:Type II secretion system secretin GspD n=1 Tax=Parendozoicomonas callyspongiae TaxID=2942213 RepID=A0ABT0PIF8_9GAMM|nr:type II secretion system secretin GspD [Sansalvadorimonas sp. 2012CJ34-2]MCL6271139.1 type II secretion system secretin GspD [Sansalvadorimonas sp. 2012CJ34-2]
MTMRRLQSLRWTGGRSVLLALTISWLPTSIWADNHEEQFIPEQPEVQVAAPAEKKPAKPEEKRWTLNQQNADIREFIAQIATITGESFVIDPRIKGGNTVSVISSRPMTKDQIYDIFLEVLSANGYAVIPKGKVRSIIPSTTAKTTSSTFEGKDKPAKATMVTRVIDLHSVSAVEVIPIVRPLIAQYGHAAASASGNAVVISDQKDNVDRITKLVRELDNASDNDYEVLALEHAWVGDVAKIIQDTLSTGKGHLPSGMQVIADERSNRLVIKGNANKRSRVRKLVQTLDKEGIRKSSTRVIFLRHADAKNLAEILNEASQTIQDDSQENKSGSSSTPKPRNSSNRPNPQTANKPASFKSKGLGSDTFIKADESTNALVMIADPDTLKELENLVRQLDVRRAQVLIEAAVVEVKGDIKEALGFQWGFQGKNPTGQRGSEGVTDAISVVGAAQDLSKLNFGQVLLRNSNFGVIVNALSSRQNVNLMSTPNLMTLDNEEAELVVGQEVPFTTGSYSSDASSGKNPFNTTERKPVGLTLKVTPHIGDGNTLRLEIEQELSNLTEAVSGASGDPITNQRKIKTTIVVDNHETIVLGGILRDITTKGTEKVPLLGDIPLLGRFFTNKKDIVEKQNLMLFIKPSIIREGPDSEIATMDKYSTLRLIHSGRGITPLSGSMPETADKLFDIESHAIPEKN